MVREGDRLLHHRSHVVGLIENHSGGGEFVKVGGLANFVPVNRKGVRGLVISQNEKDVGPLGVGKNAGQAKDEGEELHSAGLGRFPDFVKRLLAQLIKSGDRQPIRLGAYQGKTPSRFRAMPIQ